MVRMARKGLIMSGLLNDKPDIYMLVAVPGTGKTWVTDQIKHNFTFIHHDGYIGHINQPETYVKAIKEAAKDSDKPLLIEAPFSISQIMGPLEAAGYEVKPVFIVEKPEVIAERYKQRENRTIPKGHLTRLNTYIQRADAMGAFKGTTKEVLEYLNKEVKHG